jgi:hypothetical protein
MGDNSLASLESGRRSPIVGFFFGLAGAVFAAAPSYAQNAAGEDSITSRRDFLAGAHLCVSARPATSTAVSKERHDNARDSNGMVRLMSRPPTSPSSTVMAAELKPLSLETLTHPCVASR